MSDPTFGSDQPFTVAEFEEHVEGSDFNAYYPERDEFECDFCSKGITYASEPRCGTYWSDRVIEALTPEGQRINGERMFTQLATMCPDCSTKQLLFPCEGYGEGRVYVTVTDDQRLVDVEVTDYSGRDDGIPWDPKELSSEIAGVPWSEQAVVADGDEYAPEDMIRVYLSMGSGIDIRELIKWDGSFDQELLAQAKGRYRKFLKKMARSGMDSGTFRRHVRGEDRS